MSHNEATVAEWLFFKSLHEAVKCAGASTQNKVIHSPNAGWSGKFSAVDLNAVMTETGFSDNGPLSAIRSLTGTSLCHDI